VKNKIYAISLLLSFLVVFSHEMIFHHHEPVADNLFDHHNAIDSLGEHSDQCNSNEEHHHPFPLHHHVSEACDFIFTRTNPQESNPLNKTTTLFLASVVFQTDLFEPPGLSINRFKDKPFLIPSNYYPAANALRGPPAIV